jgi:hypothetical protein
MKTNGKTQKDCFCAGIFDKEPGVVSAESFSTPLVIGDSPWKICEMQRANLVLRE